MGPTGNQALTVLAALFLLGAAPPRPAPPAPAAAAGPPAPTPQSNLARARVLDREGAKAYAEGRYNDAIHHFEDAYRLGGPAFELWNVAKCYLRLEQPVDAAEMLERYLAVPSLPKEDREQATQQLEALKKRPSPLSVSSSPNGAEVKIDGKSAGKTPLATTVPPGSHAVVVESSPPYSRQVEARYGGSLTVEAPPPPPSAEVPDNPYVEAEKTAHRIALRGAIALVVPRHGTIGGRAAPGLSLLGTYRIAESSRGIGFGAGALFSITGDSWGDRTGLPSEAPDCNGVRPIPNADSATAPSFFAIGSASFPLTSKLRAVGLGGVGIAGYVVENVGGDLFVPTCRASPGLRPALLFGAELDYALTSVVRLAAFPLTWQLQPAFDGTRASPEDASGIWMRFGFGIGAGVDL